MKKPILLLLATLSLTLISAQNEPLNLHKGIALDAYDVVSYFQGKPVEGTATHKTVHRGATYFFKDQENLEAFKMNPEKYLPMYGGWCAYAMGVSNDFVEVDPETYKIIDGKLFLFYNAFFNNTITKWNKDQPALLKKANENWKTHLKN